MHITDLLMNNLKKDGKIKIFQEKKSLILLPNTKKLSKKEITYKKVGLKILSLFMDYQN